MSHPMRYLLLGIFLLLLVTVPVAMKLPGQGTLEGVVSNETGPLAKASVETRNLITGADLHAISGSDGQYRIDGLSPGKYSVWVHAEEHTAVWIPMLVVESGTVTRKDFLLLRIRPITGS